VGISHSPVQLHTKQHGKIPAKAKDKSRGLLRVRKLQNDSEELERNVSSEQLSSIENEELLGVDDNGLTI
jgi:hypothetical protein